MTNAEKYQEVFGFPPLKDNCITMDFCEKCPIYKKKTNKCLLSNRRNWWDKEYKGGET